MNNSDLADRITTDHDVSKADARKLVDGVFAAIVEAAVAGDEIAINGFGKFKVKDSPRVKVVIPPPARPCRLPLPRSSALRQPRPSRTSSTDKRQSLRPHVGRGGAISVLG